MIRRLPLLGMILLVSGCPRPTRTVPGPGDPPMPPPADAPAPRADESNTIRLQPGTQRYEVYRRLRVEQELAGQAPTHMSYRVFVTATIAGSPDSVEYDVVHVIDSIVADSGTFVPPTVNFEAARGISFRGRLTALGAVRDVTPSDTAAARVFAQFLGNLRDFYPRLPRAGLAPNASWIDTVTTSGRTAGELEVRSVLQSTVTGWETRGFTRALRIQVQGTFQMQGAGEQGGQSYELTGSGTRSAVEYVAVDGRYLGGETRDSSSHSVSLPAQGMAVLIRQVLHARVSVLP
jgi:hypothetical protein